MNIAVKLMNTKIINDIDYKFQIDLLKTRINNFEASLNKLNGCNNVYNFWKIMDTLYYDKIYIEQLNCYVKFHRQIDFENGKMHYVIYECDRYQILETIPIPDKLINLSN